jgi:hypothetical protein
MIMIIMAEYSGNKNSADYSTGSELHGGVCWLSTLVQNVWYGLEGKSKGSVFIKYFGKDGLSHDQVLGAGGRKCRKK